MIVDDDSPDGYGRHRGLIGMTRQTQSTSWPRRAPLISSSARDVAPEASCSVFSAVVGRPLAVCPLYRSAYTVNRSFAYASGNAIGCSVIR
jgi:hypothetical protein